MDQEGSLSLLIYSPEQVIAEEIRDACRSSLQSLPNAFLATDVTKAIDIARDREPRIAMIDLSSDIEHDRNLIRELRAVVPKMKLVGLYVNEASSDSQSGSASQFVELVRVGVSDFLRRPLSGQEIRQLFDRLNQGETRPARMGTCITFISNKGGVGKSTLAVNTATRLAMQFPDEVLLIDASLQMGVCAPMLNLKPDSTLLDAIHQRERLDSTLLRQLTIPHPSGLSLLAAPPDAISAIEINDQMMTRILNLARRTYRFVVVDTFPMFDQIVMSVLDVSSLAFVVLDNVVPTVISASYLMRLLAELQYPPDRLRIVVNRFQRVLGNPLLEDIGRTLQAKVNYVLPYDKRAITSANTGRPYAMDLLRWSKLHRGLGELVGEILSVSSLESNRVTEPLPTSPQRIDHDRLSKGATMAQEGPGPGLNRPMVSRVPSPMVREVEEEKDRAP